MRSMIVVDFADRYDEAREALARHAVVGIESAPRAFIGLLRGQNFGKQLVITRCLC